MRYKYRKEDVKGIFPKKIPKHIPRKFPEISKWVYENERVLGNFTFKDRERHTEDSIKLMYFQIIRELFPNEYSKKKPDKLVGVKPSGILIESLRTGALKIPDWWWEVAKTTYGFTGKFDYFTPEIMVLVDATLKEIKDYENYGDVCQSIKIKKDFVLDKEPSVSSKLQIIIELDGRYKKETMKRWILAKPLFSNAPNFYNLPNPASYLFNRPDQQDAYQLKKIPDRKPDGNTISELNILIDFHLCSLAQRLDAVARETFYKKFELALKKEEKLREIYNPKINKRTLLEDNK